MKKALLTILCLLGGYAAMAQMSEEKIAQYILEQQEKGVSQEQIVMDLSRRGVTLQQLQQMREKYEKGQSTGIMGNTLVDESKVPRIRTAQQTLDTSDGLPDLQSGAYDREMAQKMRLQNMYDESMFLFVDSVELLRLSFMEKKAIFGHDMFNGKDLTFEPSTSLATPRNYRLGPGDEVIIDIWGASQSTVREVISPDGNIMVDGLGPLYLNGMTVEKADSYIKKVFSQIYSGVSSQNGESSISLSLGQNRSIQVNVLGEVENPGTYTLSSFASMFNALYMAGGPTEIGSLRNVKLYRAGKMAANLDVYDFLFNGTLPGDITLQDNDVVMVPAQTALVCIDGSIRRPMFYEMKQGESLANLIDYAGGLAGNAYRNDVRVIRMGQVQRSIHTVAANEQSSFAMSDGDSVYVDSTQITFSNMAEVRGAVFRPGMFQTDGGGDLVHAVLGAAEGQGLGCFKCLRREDFRDAVVVPPADGLTIAFFVIRHQHSSFADGKGLAAHEGHGGGISEGAKQTSFVVTALGVGDILQDLYAVLPRNRHDFVHGCGTSHVMRHHHQFGPRGDLRLKTLGGHLEGVGFDVAEYHGCP